MTTPLRRLYGGSDRPHHLAIATSASMPVAVMAYYNPGVEVMGLWLQMPHDWLWLVASVACYSHEWWATADRDEQEKRLPKTARGWAKRTWSDRLINWYWWQFGKIPHRSSLSHGLFVGTAIRLAYGWWWLLWPLWMVYPPVVVAWCAGALVADLVHLLLDL